MSPDTAGVVRQEMDRDGRLRRSSADAMDVVRRRNERIEVARLERAALEEPEPGVTVRVDLLVLCAAVQADEPPRKVIVHRGFRTGRDDEREERERAVVVP